MAWIESHQGLAKHPKTRKLIRKLSITCPAAVGYLHLLWWWAMDFAQDGDVTKFEGADIEDACEWTGQENELYNALIECGFIDIINNRREIHDWYEYAGKMIELRKKDAERKKNSRRKPEMSDGHPADIQGTSEGSLTESIRDPNLNQVLQEEEERPLTAMDAYYFSFKKLNYTGQIQGYIVELIERGFTDAFVREIFLAMGEHGANPDVNYMRKTAEDWISRGIYTLAEAKARRAKESKNVHQLSDHKREQSMSDTEKKEIHFQRWVNAGNDPSQFVYKPTS